MMDCEAARMKSPQPICAYAHGPILLSINGLAHIHTERHEAVYGCHRLSVQRQVRLFPIFNPALLVTWLPSFIQLSLHPTLRFLLSPSQIEHLAFSLSLRFPPDYLVHILDRQRLFILAYFIYANGRATHCRVIEIAESLFIAFSLSL